MARMDAFEDRGQSQRPAKRGAGARNQGGFHNSPSPRSKGGGGQIKPPPVSRARKDSILRPVNDGGSSQGGIRAGGRGGKAQVNTETGGTTATTRKVGGPPRRGPRGEVSGQEVGIGANRQQNLEGGRSHGQGGPIAPPMPRNRKGGWTAEQRAEWQAANGGGGGDIRGNSQADADGVAVSGPEGQGRLDRFDKLQGRGTLAGGDRGQRRREKFGELGARRAAGGIQAQPPGVPPTPGSVAPGDAQEAQGVAEMPPSSPANAGARAPQGPEEMGQPMSQSGNPMPTPDAEPPVNDPAVRAGMPAPEESAQGFNESVGAAGPDGFGGRMGEDLLGFKIEGSDQISNGKEWKGEIGPGMPSNQSGALGIPGQQNSPEDVAFNRGRFDSALEQNKGDKHAAALSSGAFPSGNPIAHGTMSHMDKLVNSTDGDGVDTGTMDEATKRRYKADAVRQTEEYGAYPGMDDPDSPSPPIRPLSWSFNPHTNKMVAPEGAESYIDRFGGGGE